MESSSLSLLCAFSRQRQREREREREMGEGTVSLFLIGGTGGFELGFTLAKQALYHLRYTSSAFCSGDFGDGV
jgi:hypothetical protein